VCLAAYDSAQHVHTVRTDTVPYRTTAQYTVHSSTLSPTINHPLEHSLERLLDPGPNTCLTKLIDTMLIQVNTVTNMCVPSRLAWTTCWCLTTCHHTSMPSHKHHMNQPVTTDMYTGGSWALSQALHLVCSVFLLLPMPQHVVDACVKFHCLLSCFHELMVVITQHIRFCSPYLNSLSHSSHSRYLV
jgi:hypothetical protein